MSDIFEKWNKSIDVEGLKADVKEAEQNGSVTYEEVPEGKYEVKIDKMELKESKKGDPMFSAWFKILEGDYKNQLIFMNQVITQGFQIGIVDDFIRSLDVIEDVKFENYSQYNNMIMDAKEAVDTQGLEFLLNYSKNNKGFSKFEIKEVYEK
jgi:Protein of unknown function (DUF669).